MAKFGPILAATISSEDDYKYIEYPINASPKIDGIRILCSPTLGPVSRSLKPIPNEFLRNHLSDKRLKNLDGELTVGFNPYADKIFNQTQSAYLSHDWIGNFTFNVFDHFGSSTIGCPYGLRYNDAEVAVQNFDRAAGFCFIRMHHHTTVYNREELDAAEAVALAHGAEGLILRNPHGIYKHGRSTLKQANMFKLKRFADGEARVYGWEPLEHNTNEAFVDALGHQKRSSHKAGMVVNRNLMGKLLVEGITEPWMGVKFAIGSGFDLDEREEPERYMGKVITYKYLPIGSIDKPRHGIFKGVRND